MKKSLVFLLFLAIGAMSAVAQSFEPKWVGNVSALKIDSDTVAIATEKANEKVKTTQSLGTILVGIGNVRQKAVIEGHRSTTQLSPNDPVILVIKCHDNESDPTSFIQIVKFEETKKERKAELSMENWVGNVSKGNMKLVPYEAECYGKSSYILRMQPQEGEFGVRMFNPNTRDEKVEVFYCFGIHNDAK